MSLLNGLLARGVVALANSARKLQTLQMRLTAGEIKDGMEHLEPYGFTSCPLPGAEGLAAFLGGDRSHGVVVVVTDRRHRIQGLEPGEVAIFTDEGDFIRMKRGRVIDIETHTLNIRAATAVNFDTPLITQTGQLESQGDVKAGGVSLINHPHAGVQPGSGQTGKPVAG
ncbi:phage baseplate assembly protein V [Pseudomonas oryzihabitans]|uniref:phage baseplate assembly protein V n=1 Tax=Pseudomonas oryzihabitans TaxID=47885 RepID=UPI00123A18D7|nr:phage baseplate assembly protein [Pseudomonas oryzihabitans]QEU03082.1 phage baseplate assembly protein V [Pseudomonas oryzihabitans]